MSWHHILSITLFAYTGFGLFDDLFVKVLLDLRLLFVRGAYQFFDLFLTLFELMDCLRVLCDLVVHFCHELSVETVNTFCLSLELKVLHLL